MKIETIDNPYSFTPVKVNLQITIETKEELSILNRELNLLVGVGVCDENGDRLSLCDKILEKIRKTI